MDYHKLNRKVCTIIKSNDIFHMEQLLFHIGFSTFERGKIHIYKMLIVCCRTGSLEMFKLLFEYFRRSSLKHHYIIQRCAKASYVNNRWDIATYLKNNFEKMKIKNMSQLTIRYLGHLIKGGLNSTYNPKHIEEILKIDAYKEFIFGILLCHHIVEEIPEDLTNVHLILYHMSFNNLNSHDRIVPMDISYSLLRPENRELFEYLSANTSEMIFYYDKNKNFIVMNEIEFLNSVYEYKISGYNGELLKLSQYENGVLSCYGTFIVRIDDLLICEFVDPKITEVDCAEFAQWREMKTKFANITAPVLLEEARQIIKFRHGAKNAKSVVRHT